MVYHYGQVPTYDVQKNSLAIIRIPGLMEGVYFQDVFGIITFSMVPAPTMVSKVSTIDLIQILPSTHQIYTLLLMNLKKTMLST